MDRFMIIIPRDPGELHEHIETWIDLSARVDKWRDYYNVTDVMMIWTIPMKTLNMSPTLLRCVPRFKAKREHDDMDELVNSFERLSISEPQKPMGKPGILSNLNNMKSKPFNSCSVNSPADAKDSSSSDPALTLKETK